jgi:hypothetical protein
MVWAGLLAGAVLMAWVTPEARAQCYSTYSFGWAPAPVVVAPPPVFVAPAPAVVAAPVYRTPVYVYRRPVIRRSIRFHYYGRRHRARVCYPRNHRRSFGFGFHYSH